MTNGGVDEQHEYLTDDEITINLLHLVRNCDAAELTSMEQIVGELFKTQQVQATVINSIIAHLQRAADATPEYGLRKDAGACIRLLSMVAHSDGGVLDADTVALVVKAALPAGGGVGDADGAAHVGVDLSAVGAAARCFQMMPSAVSRCFGEGYAKVCSSSLQKALDGAVKGFCDVVLGKSATASGTVK